MDNINTNTEFVVLNNLREGVDYGNGCVIRGMLQYCGMTVHVDRALSNNKFKILEDGGRFNWTVEMMYPTPTTPPMQHPDSKKIIDNMIADHILWVESGRKRGHRAVFRNLDLGGYMFANLNLNKIHFENCSLNKAKFYKTELRDARFVNSILRGASFEYCEMEDASFSQCQGEGLEIRYCNLAESRFDGVNLDKAVFYDSAFVLAYLEDCSMVEALLDRSICKKMFLINCDVNKMSVKWANLAGCKFAQCKNIDTIMPNNETAFFALQCPEEGSFVGWKKLHGGAIAKLEICQDALRSSATSRKCRASKAKVLEIYANTPTTRACSKYDLDFVYEVGKIVEVEDFDTNRWNECTSGIHFFITRKEAEMYE